MRLVKIKELEWGDVFRWPDNPHYPDYYGMVLVSIHSEVIPDVEGKRLVADMPLGEVYYVNNDKEVEFLFNASDRWGDFVSDQSI